MHHMYNDTLHVCTVKVSVKRVVFLIHIWEAPSSSLRPESGFPDWAVLWFFSVPPGKCFVVPQLRPWSFPTMFFPIHYSVVIIQHCVLWAIESIVRVSAFNFSVLQLDNCCILTLQSLVTIYLLSAVTMKKLCFAYRAFLWVSYYSQN
jgi:hypothetical protein